MTTPTVEEVLALPRTEFARDFFNRLSSLMKDSEYREGIFDGFKRESHKHPTSEEMLEHSKYDSGYDTGKLGRRFDDQHKSKE